MRSIRKLMGVIAFSMLTSGTAFALSGQISLSKESKTCIGCHKEISPGIVEEWRASKHAGGGIGCFECHQAQSIDPDAQKHFGFYIRVVISPKVCGKCHVQEAKEFMASSHAHSGKYVYSPKNVLGMLTTGMPNNFAGCARCHGAKVVLDEKGSPIAGPWPNQGIGRFNPDGSIGACSACHYSHRFSLKQAREPETCGRCHQGPDHPDIEIWHLSKHGIAWKVYKNEFESKLDRTYFVVGRDYTHAPACFTCHMGATANGLKTTHDVEARSSWILRRAISKRTKHWKKARKDMEKVCMNCHTRNWVKSHFKLVDAFVELYNEKFAIPATKLVKFLHEVGVLDKIPFNEQVEWDYWHLWHHEGRRARQGVAMMSADYAHWQGIYVVAYNFYMQFLPNADRAVMKAYKEGKISKAVVERWNNMKKSILSRKDHKWFTASSMDEIKALQKYYMEKFIEKMKN